MKIFATVHKHVYNRFVIHSNKKVKMGEVNGLNKKEVLELKRRMKKDSCTFTRICGCYVDSKRNRVTNFSKTFLNLDDEELFKYLEIAKKVLSGTIGDQLLELDFPLEQEEAGGRQQFLLGLRESKLKNDELLERFYDLVIENYESPGNYLILIFHDSYDIPIKTSDNLKLDESDEIYEYLLCAVCPVKLSKPGLGYLEESNEIGLRVRDWVVDVPDAGFLFPAFTERSTDIHSSLFYTRNTKQPPIDLMEGLLGCKKKLTATEQKEVFRCVLEDTLGNECNYDTIKKIHDEIQDKVSSAESQSDDIEPEPIELSKESVKELLKNSGVSEEKLAKAEEVYEEKVGQDHHIFADNIIDKRKFEVKTYDVVLHVKPEKASKIKSQIIDGQKYLVIPMDENENVNVNGIQTIV